LMKYFDVIQFRNLCWTRTPLQLQTSSFPLHHSKQQLVPNQSN
jgi:hypothetical protein